MTALRRARGPGLVLLSAALAVSVLPGQVTERADAAALRAGLSAGESAEIAWASYRIATGARAEFVPELRRVLAGLVREPVATERHAEQRYLVMTVFDALIRTGATLSTTELLPWRTRMPTAVLILAARDAETHAGLLLSFVENRRMDPCRLAATNLLLTGMPAMLMPQLLADAEVDLTVHVTSPGEFVSCWSSGSGRGCGRGRRLPGFPPVVSYRLQVRAGETFADGPEPVGWSRVEHTRASYGVVSSVVSLEERDYAWRCLYRLAEREVGTARLRGTVHESVEWRDEAGLRATVVEIEAGMRAEYGELRAELARRQLCSSRAARLRIGLRLEDERPKADREVALPTPAELRRGGEGRR